jgi:hypothetical protein
MPHKTKIPLTSLKDRFNSTLQERGHPGEVNYFGRDAIVKIFSYDMETVAPPFPQLLNAEESQLVKAFYDGQRSEMCIIAAHREKELLLELFAQFLSKSGDSEYYLISEGFYDDPDYEEVKAFLLSCNYSITEFIEEETLSGLLGSCDTLVSSRDFQKILIFFHHDLYEMHTQEFGLAFCRFVSGQTVSIG